MGRERLDQPGDEEGGLARAFLGLGAEGFEIELFIHQQGKRPGEVFLALLPAGLEAAHHLADLPGHAAQVKHGTSIVD